MRKATDQRHAKTIPLLCTSFLLFHGGDVLRFEVKCFDVLMSVAGSGDVVVTSFDAMSRDAMQCHGDERLYVSSTAAGWNVIGFARPRWVFRSLSVRMWRCNVLFCTKK